MIDASARMRPFLKAVAVLVLGLAPDGPVIAAPPPQVPGDEITDRQYLESVLPGDSVAARTPTASPHAATWLDEASKTWDAPPLSEQIAQDKEDLLMGMGALFVPRMSEALGEPDIEIRDSTDHVVAVGKPGRKFSLVPGRYRLLAGSGRQRQRIEQRIEVQENELIPVLPEFCGLSIEVVDENNIPFRGEYELVRVQDYEPFGRGYGREPDLGEELKTWILKPGVYKILRVGASYNALTNFVTVRLLPGEFTRFLLVQNKETMDIAGGGLVTATARTRLASNWKYGLDVGGTFLMNSDRDRRADTTINSSSFTLLFNSRLNYRKRFLEWDTRLNMDEGLNFDEFSLSGITTAPDELRFSSLLVWRILPWLGPYARSEALTGVFPTYQREPEGVRDHVWVLLHPDSTLDRLNTSPEPVQLQPVFSPFSFEAGVGANMNVLRKSFLEWRILAGFGFTQARSWGESQVTDSAAVRLNATPLDSLVGPRDFTVIRRLETTVTQPEYGPEAASDALIRIGRSVILDTEFKIFVPLDRLSKSEAELLPDTAEARPPLGGLADMRLRSTLSWRVARPVSLDYSYSRTIRWPDEVDLKQNDSQHRVLVRFSYTSR